MEATQEITQEIRARAEAKVIAMPPVAKIIIVILTLIPWALAYAVGSCVRGGRWFVAALEIGYREGSRVRGIKPKE